ncbi:hypothetical protein WMY93_004097 [Mugilogobius chulae]|uniref:Uncharacterized protein n=1 Tax=Mugilogobius chulae TaxID=88201 RepID=A0AAW0PXA4_9GOBI
MVCQIHLFLQEGGGARHVTPFTHATCRNAEVLSQTKPNATGASRRCNIGVSQCHRKHLLPLYSTTEKKFTPGHVFGFVYVVASEHSALIPRWRHRKR